MMRYKLIRESEMKPDCTLGILRNPDDEAICCTLEPAWNHNKKGSCIPEGVYRVTRFKSPSKNPQLDGQVFLLHDVPERDMVEIHIGNRAKDTLGCILPGRVYGRIEGERAVLHSTETMTRLLKDMPDEWEIEVV